MMRISPRRRRGTGWRHALPWLGPSLALIAAVVLYPTFLLVRASLSRYSITGLYQSFVGPRNYVRLLAQDALPAVAANTVVWVTVVVVVTILVSLALAQFVNQSFPGRQLVRWALIVPWAASLIMTSKLFVWIYDYYFGILNRVLTAVGFIDRPVDWLGDDRTVMGAMIAVGVFVSLPFTTYVLLAGLQAIPGEVYEAARVDGASGWRTYRAVTPESELRTSPPRLLPVRWRFENFLAVLADPGFQTWLQVSLIVAVASTALVVLAAVPAAYYTARHRFRGRSAFLFLVLVTQMFSPTALVVGLYREFFELDLVT